MTEQLTAKEALALRRSLEQRLAEAEPWPYRQQRLLQWLSGVPDSHLVQEARVIQTALADPRTAKDTLFAMVCFFYSPERAGSPRLTPGLRAALLQRVSRGEFTKGTVDRTVRELLEADEESYSRKVAQLLGANTKPSFAGTHTVLAYGLRAAPEQALPPGPFHRGELRPNIGARGYGLLGITMAHAVAQALTPFQRDLCNTMMKEILAITDGGLAASSYEPPVFEGETPPSLLLLGSALKEARIAHRRADLVGGSMRPIMAKAVKQLARERGPDATRAFLVGLDEELRRLDVVHVLFQKEMQPSSAVAQALWRGGDERRVLFWLARLEEGGCGLLSKIGRRWRWTEGARDDVLATVPDDRFEEAVTAAVGAADQ